jgi:hypothetical protein
MNEQPSLLQQLESAPKNIVVYLVSLPVAILTDYALLTLAIACVLLGIVVGSALIGAMAFFGAYFIMRLVNNLAEGLGSLAQATGQSNMQVAAAIAQATQPPSPPIQEGMHEFLPDTLP